jgi:hypothetical protein
LPLGSYTIRLTREGHVTAERRVRLTPRQSTATLAIALQPVPARGTGSILVRSRPTGARVFVNDRLIGATPLAIPELPVGPATVRLEMDDYRTWATTVVVAAGEQARVGASLDRR